MRFHTFAIPILSLQRKDPGMGDDTAQVQQPAQNHAATSRNLKWGVVGLMCVAVTWAMFRVSSVRTMPTVRDDHLRMVLYELRHETERPVPATRRLMFVGDSITEGLGHRHGSQRGICSFRFELMLHIEKILMERRIDVLSVETSPTSRGIGSTQFVTVGPFRGTAASTTVPSKCQARAKTVGKQLGLKASLAGNVTTRREFTAHAAVWAGRLWEILDPSGTPPYDRQRANFRTVAAMPHPDLQEGKLHGTSDAAGSTRSNARAAMASNAASAAPPLPPSVATTSALAKWMRAHRPDVVLFLLGTNDLTNGTKPAALLAQVAQAIGVMLGVDLRPDATLLQRRALEKATLEDVRNRTAVRCPVRIVVSTLLDRREPSRLDVRDFNALLSGKIVNGMAVTTPAKRTSQPRDLVGTRKAAHTPDPGTTADTAAAVLFQHPCVRRVHGAAAFHWKPHTDDGVHPNDAGERLLARNLAPALADALDA
jgi:hypothetical protein